MKRRSINQLLLGMALMPAINGFASQSVPRAYLSIGLQKNVPSGILYAVAMAESGAAYQDNRQPWPWALNINGEGFYCESKHEAQLKIHQALRVDHLIDIGLMQISWRWHQQAFNNVNEALLPMKNLWVGASILREQFEISGDWWKAVGRYHDPGQDRVSLASAEQYRNRVKHIWQGILT